MSYYIDGPFGKIYFYAHNLSNVLVYQTNDAIKRRNISFVDENIFAKFSNLYPWNCMNIIKRNDSYYLIMFLINNNHYIFNIKRDLNYYYHSDKEI